MASKRFHLKQKLPKSFFKAADFGIASYNVARRPIESFMNFRARHLSQRYLIAGKYKRIYHYHIAKTGGTSLNYAMLSLGKMSGDMVYHGLAYSRSHRFISGDKVFVGWQKDLLKRGDFFYGFSHLPVDKIGVPQGSFRMTIVRNPVARAVSYYKMLVTFKELDYRHPAMNAERAYLGNSFSDFLLRVPRRHLMAQLRMFSPQYNPAEALENIMKLEYIMFTEELDRDVKILSKRIGYDVSLNHVRVNPRTISLSHSDMKKLEGLVKPEIKFYDLLMDAKKRALNKFAS